MMIVVLSPVVYMMTIDDFMIVLSVVYMMTGVLAACF